MFFAYEYGGIVMAGTKNPGTGRIRVMVFRVPGGLGTRMIRTGRIRVKKFGYRAGTGYRPSPKIAKKFFFLKLVQPLTKVITFHIGPEHIC